MHIYEYIHLFTDWRKYYTAIKFKSSINIHMVLMRIFIDDVVIYDDNVIISWDNDTGLVIFPFILTALYQKVTLKLYSYMNINHCEFIEKCNNLQYHLNPCAILNGSQFTIKGVHFVLYNNNGIIEKIIRA